MCGLKRNRISLGVSSVTLVMEFQGLNTWVRHQFQYNNINFWYEFMMSCVLHLSSAWGQGSGWVWGIWNKLFFSFRHQNCTSTTLWCGHFLPCSLFCFQTRLGTSMILYVEVGWLPPACSQSFSPCQF